MVLYDVKFPELNAGDNPPIEVTGTTVLTKVTKYSKWLDDDMIKYQLQFYMTPGLSIRSFYKKADVGVAKSSIPEKTFGTYWRVSGLKSMQNSNTAFKMAKVAIEHYIASLKKMLQSEQ
jgi:hypothetical protein